MIIVNQRIVAARKCPAPRNGGGLTLLSGHAPENVADNVEEVPGPAARTGRWLLAANDPVAQD